MHHQYFLIIILSSIFRRKRHLDKSNSFSILIGTPVHQYPLLRSHSSFLWPQLPDGRPRKLRKTHKDVESRCIARKFMSIFSSFFNFTTATVWVWKITLHVAPCNSSLNLINIFKLHHSVLSTFYQVDFTIWIISSFILYFKIHNPLNFQIDMHFYGFTGSQMLEN